MLLPLDLRIHLAARPADMRKSSQTLGVLVKTVLEKDPFCGHLFVFYNKRRDLVKILYWHINGFCLWQKRLEKGTFPLPSDFSVSSLEISAYHLQGFIQGIDCWKIKTARKLDYRHLS